MSLRLELPTPSDTEALGATLAAACPARAVLYLEGELGAGKSTLARGLLRALGVCGTIRSPTYPLIERYRLANGDEAVHLDLYRIAETAELDFLGLDELATQAALWLIEWPERGLGVLPSADLRLRLALSDPGRRAELEAGTATGGAWLDTIHNG